MLLKDNMTDKEMISYLRYWIDYYRNIMVEHGQKVRTVIGIFLNKATTTYAENLNVSRIVANQTYSRYNFFKGNDSCLHQVIVHELIHAHMTVKHGHGADWRAKAAFYNRLFGMSISRTTSNREFQERIPKRSGKVIYKVVCKDCGKVYLRKRQSNLTKHPESYFCGVCHGALKVELCN